MGRQDVFHREKEAAKLTRRIKIDEDVEKSKLEREGIGTTVTHTAMVLWVLGPAYLR
jgi:hypothetical protein